MSKSKTNPVNSRLNIECQHPLNLTWSTVSYLGLLRVYCDSFGFIVFLHFFPTSSEVIVFLENKFQNLYALTLRLKMRWTYSSNAVHSKLSPKHCCLSSIYGSMQCYGLIAAVHLCAVSQCARSGEAMSCQVMLFYELQIYGQTSASASVREKRNKNLTRRHAGGIKMESLHKNRLQTL